MNPQVAPGRESQNISNQVRIQVSMVPWTWAPFQECNTPFPYSAILYDRNSELSHLFFVQVTQRQPLVECPIHPPACEINSRNQVGSRSRRESPCWNLHRRRWLRPLGEARGVSYWQYCWYRVFGSVSDNSSRFKVTEMVIRGWNISWLSSAQSSLFLQL